MFSVIIDVFFHPITKSSPSRPVYIRCFEDSEAEAEGKVDVEVEDEAKVADEDELESRVEELETCFTIKATLCTACNNIGK